MMFFWVMIGAAIAAVLIWFLKKINWEKRPLTYANMLIIAAMIYVGFALFTGELAWMYIEIIGVVLFFLMALIGLKVSYWFLAFGWAAHVLWDVGLHSVEKTPFVPGWYPAACVGFDLVIAGYLLFLIANKGGILHGTQTFIRK